MSRRGSVISVLFLMTMILVGLTPYRVKAQIGELTPQVYLPLVLSPGCDHYKAAVYASSTGPTVSVRESFTITTAVVNDGCAGLGKILYDARIESDAGIVAWKETARLSQYIGPGQHGSAQFVFALMQTGQFTITGGTSFEANYGSRFGWGGAESVPLMLRVLPPANEWYVQNYRGTK